MKKPVTLEPFHIVRARRIQRAIFWLGFAIGFLTGLLTGTVLLAATLAIIRGET